MTEQVLKNQIAQAWVLIRNGDQFHIGRRFLIQNGVI